PSSILPRPPRYRADCGAGADTKLVADDVLYGVQGARRGPDPYFPAERAVRADHRDSRGSVLRPREDGRGGSRRARTSGPAHLCQPADAVGRDRMDLVDRHRVRRDLSTPASRGQGKSPPELKGREG